MNLEASKSPQDNSCQFTTVERTFYTKWTHLVCNAVVRVAAPTTAAAAPVAAAASPGPLLLLLLANALCKLQDLLIQGCRAAVAAEPIAESATATATCMVKG